MTTQTNPPILPARPAPPPKTRTLSPFEQAFYGGLFGEMLAAHEAAKRDWPRRGLFTDDELTKAGETSARCLASPVQSVAALDALYDLWRRGRDRASYQPGAGFDVSFRAFGMTPKPPSVSAGKVKGGAGKR